MSTATGDYAWGLSCTIAPGQQAYGPGVYLIGANSRVECGPFDSDRDAQAAMTWMERNGYGVHPAPWRLYESKSGLLVGSRLRPPRDRQ